MTPMPHAQVFWRSTLTALFLSLPAAAQGLVEKDPQAAPLRRLLDDGRSPLFELVDAGRVRQALEQGAPLPSPRASASPTAGLAYLLNLDRWLTRHGVDISL